MPPNDIASCSSVTQIATYDSGLLSASATAALADLTKPALSLSLTFVAANHDIVRNMLEKIAWLKKGQLGGGAGVRR